MGNRLNTPETDQVTRTWAEIQQMGMKLMTVPGADWFERVADLNAELVGFMAERFQQDVELQHRLLRCRTPAELQAVQSEFFQNAVDRYIAESGRIMELAQGMVAPSSGETSED